MLSSQLFWRVFLVYAGLTVGTAVAFVLILTHQQRDTIQVQVEQHLREDADALAAILAGSFDGERLDAPTRDLLDSVTRRKSSHSAVIGKNGDVVWSAPAGVNLWADSATAPEVRTAEQSGAGFALRPGPQSSGELLYYAQRLDSRDPHAGFVRVVLPFDEIVGELSAGHSQLWAAAASIGIVALAVTYLAVGRIIGPLETLTQAAQQLTAGKTPSEVSIHSRNEIGTLASVFNSMSRQLAARIGDLQEQRQQLEANHQRLETVLGAMLDGVIAVDAEEKILFANNAAIRLMELKPTIMLGRPLWEAIRHQPLIDLVRSALRDEPVRSIEIEVPRTQNTVAVTATRLPGEPSTGAVVVVHDVTELRRLEKLRSEFVQNVNHELKTPLSSISAYADTLLEGGLDDPGCNRQFVERIAEQADRLNALIQDLLALGRMESADEGFEVEPIDVTRVIAASVDAHLGVAKAKRLALISEGPSEPIWGLSDDEGLRTIVDNLLDNAINYTPPGGQVTVRWKRAGPRVIVQVQDTGVGIAREHQQRIFQRFFRIDKARSRELGGTGLGLAIVKHLCQVFGGTVSVNSQLGQGSTFTVELQAAEVLVTS